jgi:hypothetical protein
MDAGHDEDDAGPDEDGGDAGIEMDAGAGDDAGATVDGCVLSASGACAACDEDTYVPDRTSCGSCFPSPSRCVGGIEYACAPGTQRSPDDTTCDGIDDDCDGRVDEDYKSAMMSSCGIGVCESTGEFKCENGKPVDKCEPKMLTATRDDATGAGNGLDDDCDGSIDEDVSSCTNTAPLTFQAGVHNNIVAPSGCGNVTIQLWGGAGAAGQQSGISDVERGGHGGSGGYVRSTLPVNGVITLYVGNGAPAGCNAGGANLGASTYSGGSGGEDTGEPGFDKMVSGGGAFAKNLFGLEGGRGHYGGGGGGGTVTDLVNDFFAQKGGGGGAASVAFMSGVRVLVAGGGGGGGAASSLVYSFGAAGGDGGEGCSGAGTPGDGLRAGGGGGGGVCIGTVKSMGVTGTPANAGLLPMPLARGTDLSCAAGGNGYAIVTFAR